MLRLGLSWLVNYSLDTENEKIYIGIRLLIEHLTQEIRDKSAIFMGSEWRFHEITKHSIVLFLYDAYAVGRQFVTQIILYKVTACH